MERAHSSQHVAKEALRKLVRRCIAEMTSQQRSEEAQFVVGELLRSSEVRSSQNKNIALYIALPERELDMTHAFTELRKLGKRVLLPRVGADDVMRFVDFAEDAPLEKHRIGFLQPTEACPEVQPDVVVCPGRAFDAAGHRVGFGKGYYDRGLAKLAAPPVTIGVCFRCQFFASVPHEDHDRAMTRVLVMNQ